MFRLTDAKTGKSWVFATDVIAMESVIATTDSKNLEFYTMQAWYGASGIYCKLTDDRLYTLAPIKPHTKPFNLETGKRL